MQAMAATHPDLFTEGVVDVTDGDSPLHVAASEGKAEVLELLLSTPGGWVHGEGVG